MHLGHEEETEERAGDKGELGRVGPMTASTSGSRSGQLCHGCLLWP